MTLKADWASGDQITAAATNAVAVAVNANTVAISTKATATEFYAKDYGVVSDGITNDVSALNSLITNVSAAGGGVIIIPIGTTLVNSSVVMASNVKLRGLGWTSIIKLGANVDGYGVIQIGAVSNIAIENLKIDGNRSSLTLDNSGIRGGIPGGYSDVLIRNVWVDSVNNIGIVTLGSSTRATVTKNIRILDCKVTNVGGCGILSQWGVDQCWIERCSVVGHGLVYTDSPGITNGRYAYDTFMIDNYVDSTGAIGTSPNSVSIDAPYARFKCAGNSVVNPVGIGLEIGMATDGVVVGNNITGGAKAGIKFTSDQNNNPGTSNLGVVVANNTIDGSTGGIVCWMGNVVAGQACPASRTILRSTAYSAAATMRAVEGRRMYECTTSGTSSATKPSGLGTTATGDTVTDGSSVWTDKGGTNAQLAITGNVIRNITGSGIDISYAHLVSITDNVVTNCTESGIYIYSHVNMFTIDGNSVQGNNPSASVTHGGIRIVAYSGAPHTAKIGYNRAANNNFDIAVVDSAAGARIDNRFIAATTQPTVAYGDTFYTQNTAPTTITAFLDNNAVNSRTIFVRVADSFTTFQHSASGTNSIQLTGGVDFSPASGTIMQFTWIPALNQWVEASRTTYIHRSTVTLTGSSTLSADMDYVVFIGASGAPTLPTAVGNIRKYTFKNIHSATRTIATTSSQTIEGLTSYVLPVDASIDVLSDGANWRII